MLGVGEGVVILSLIVVIKVDIVESNDAAKLKLELIYARVKSFAK